MMESRNAAIGDRTALAVLVLIVVALFADVLLLGANLHARDLSITYFPSGRILRDIVLSGEFPFWNPRTAAGQPLAANPGFAAFYPTRLLLLLPSFVFGFHLEIALHYLIAAAGMYALVRTLGSRPAAALIAAVSFGFGGLMASYSNLLPFLFSTALLPWVLFFAWRFLEERSVRRFAGTALVLALLLLTGEQSVILQAGILLAGLAIWHSREQKKMTPALAIVLVACVIAAATVAAAVQIVPAFDFKRDTPRASALPFAQVTMWSTHPVRALELVFPNFLGRFSGDTALFWGTHFVRGAEVPFTVNFYPGLLATLLAAAALWRRMRGWQFAGAIGGAMLLVSFGEHTPLFRLLYRLGLNAVRYPEKFFTTVVFLVALLAGVAAERMLEDAELRKRLAMISAAVAAIAGVALAVSLVSRGAPFRVLFGHESSLEIDGWRAGWMIALATSAVLAGLLGMRGISDSGRTLALVAFAVLDVAARFNGLVPRVGPGFYDAPPVAQRFAASGRDDVRIYNDNDLMRLYGRSLQPKLSAEATAWLVRNAMLPMRQAQYGFGGVYEFDMNSTFLAPSTRLNGIFQSARLLGRRDRVDLLLGMAGTTHVLTERVVQPSAIRSESDLETMQPVDVQARPGSRHYFADQLVPVATFEEFRQQIASPRPFSAHVAFATIAFAPARGTVLNARETANTAGIDVEAEGRALLVRAVTAHRYWTATLDGAPAPIVPTNVAFQGVEIPAGRHRVEFRYSNPVVSGSAAVSAIAFAGLIAMLFVRRRI